MRLDEALMNDIGVLADQDHRNRTNMVEFILSEYRDKRKNQLK